mgnify:CR=1 FL=1
MSKTIHKIANHKTVYQIVEEGSAAAGVVKKGDTVVVNAEGAVLGVRRTRPFSIMICDLTSHQSYYENVFLNV